MRVVYLWKTAAIVCAKIQKRNVSTKITGEATLQTAPTPLTPRPCTRMLKVHLWYNDWGVKESVSFLLNILTQHCNLWKDYGDYSWWRHFFFSPFIAVFCFWNVTLLINFTLTAFETFAKVKLFFFYPCKISLKLLKWQKCTPKMCFHKLIITHFWGIPC